MVRRGTYSIVARDPDTGELGAAVQSHWFSVGSIVTWARPGVGAVCTQSIAEPAYGEPWRKRVDLRVEDHPEPLDELERLLGLCDAYDLATQGDHLTGEGRHQEAGDRYRAAAALAPGNHELLFWAGMAEFAHGD